MLATTLLTTPLLLADEMKGILADALTCSDKSIEGKVVVEEVMNRILTAVEDYLYCQVHDAMREGCRPYSYCG
jgi:hypothetical protein